ncbi:MAG TPA: hypothetical protein VN843_13925 [Anaerolineales bacterium]|nr:hypothetical protein [Anaerolineales bacterium]
MFQNPGFFLVKLLTFFLFIIIGIWLGFMAFQLWLRVDATDIFVRWQQLKGQQKFEHIFYAHSWEVWAHAITGTDYVYRTGACDEMKCYEWLEAKSDTHFDLGMQQIIRSGCQHSYHYYINSDPLSRLKPRYPPQHTASPAECVLVIEHNPYNGAESQIYYVLLDNGDIWMWKYIPDLSGEFILFFAFPLAGLIIGIIIWYRFQKALSQNKLQGAT